MTFGELLSFLTIKPLELIFETIYAIADSISHNAFISIALLSIGMNLLVMPLYARADKIQADENAKQKRMEHWVKHIKKTFHKEERLMMLQTYYRQNDYKPYSSLLQTIPLLLQVPFFIAAYRFLSSLSLLEGTSLGPIRDLSLPDAVFQIGGFPINVLPILMTVINIASGIIYTKNQPLRTKIQVYGIAVLFMVLLYNSPSGLVLYWTFNNIFSLIKNIITKLIIEKIREKKQKDKQAEKVKEPSRKSSKLIFFLGGFFLAILVGGYIPTNVIKASTSEFVDILNMRNPLLHIGYSMAMAVGTFVIWAGIFYLLAREKTRIAFERVIWILCGIAVVNYLVVGKSLGQISPLLMYPLEPVFGKKKIALSLLLGLIIIAAILIADKKKKEILRAIAIASFLSVFVLTFINGIKINKDYKALDYLASQEGGESVNFKLSKTGKNVVVFMMDRALGTETPYLFEQNPKLKEQFDGFTYYKNTVSFGPYTNFGVPALYGGYEYTPSAMNERDDLPMVEKHNESLKVLPVLFDENGYDVTVCDPRYANYNWIPDLSIYDEYENIHSYITVGKLSEGAPEDSMSREYIWHRNFFCHSVMKIAPLFLQKAVYQYGLYNDLSYRVRAEGDPKYVNAGYNLAFMENYLVMKNLSRITRIEEKEENTFLILSNSTTHEPTLLQEPDYEPKKYVDNTAYHTGDEHYIVDGVELNMSYPEQYYHYHANMAAMMKLGDWFDYLRENDCYDNTRIIIVADHGRNVGHLNLIKDGVDMEYFMPLLMVKDFNAKGFETSLEFMTNADTPALAVEGLIENPVNPFTGNALDGHEKTEEEIKIIYSQDWDTERNNGNRFWPADWYTVKDSPYDLDNWEYIGRE